MFYSCFCFFKNSATPKKGAKFKRQLWQSWKYIKGDFACSVIFAIFGPILVAGEQSRSQNRKTDKSHPIFVLWKFPQNQPLWIYLMRENRFIVSIFGPFAAPSVGNYWVLLHKFNFHWRISMSVNIFPLVVFDFGASRISILVVQWLSKFLMILPTKVTHFLSMLLCWFSHLIFFR